MCKKRQRATFCVAAIKLKNVKKNLHFRNFSYSRIAQTSYYTSNLIIVHTDPIGFGVSVSVGVTLFVLAESCESLDIFAPNFHSCIIGKDEEPNFQGNTGIHLNRCSSF